MPILARTAGLLAHLAEEQQQPVGFLMAGAAEDAITLRATLTPSTSRLAYLLERSAFYRAKGIERVGARRDRRPCR